MSYKPTPGMIAEAKRGLAWRKEFNRGGTDVGVARARDISNGKLLPLETVKRMHSYFARHEIDKDGKGFSPGEEGYPSAGRIAWALWGGDPGKSWAARIVDQADGKKESTINVVDEHLNDFINMPFEQAFPAGELQDGPFQTDTSSPARRRQGRVAQLKEKKRVKLGPEELPWNQHLDTPAGQAQSVGTEQFRPDSFDSAEEVQYDTGGYDYDENGYPIYVVPSEFYDAPGLARYGKYLWYKPLNSIRHEYSVSDTDRQMITEVFFAYSNGRAYAEVEPAIPLLEGTPWKEFDIVQRDDLLIENFLDQVPDLFRPEGSLYVIDETSGRWVEIPNWPPNTPDSLPPNYRPNYRILARRASIENVRQGRVAQLKEKKRVKLGPQDLPWNQNLDTPAGLAQSVGMEKFRPDSFDSAEEVEYEIDDSSVHIMPREFADVSWLAQHGKYLWVKNFSPIHRYTVFDTDRQMFTDVVFIYSNGGAYAEVEPSEFFSDESLLEELDIVQRDDALIENFLDQVPDLFRPERSFYTIDKASGRWIEIPNLPPTYTHRILARRASIEKVIKIYAPLSSDASADLLAELGDVISVSDDVTLPLAQTEGEVYDVAAKIGEMMPKQVELVADSDGMVIQDAGNYVYYYSLGQSNLKPLLSAIQEALESAELPCNCHTADKLILGESANGEYRVPTFKPFKEKLTHIIVDDGDTAVPVKFSGSDEEKEAAAGWNLAELTSTGVETNTMEDINQTAEDPNMYESPRDMMARRLTASLVTRNGKSKLGHDTLVFEDSGARWIYNRSVPSYRLQQIGSSKPELQPAVVSAAELPAIMWTRDDIDPITAEEAKMSDLLLSIKSAVVESPYSQGEGPLGTRFEDDKRYKFFKGGQFHPVRWDLQPGEDPGVGGGVPATEEQRRLREKYKLIQKEPEVKREDPLVIGYQSYGELPHARQVEIDEILGTMPDAMLTQYDFAKHTFDRLPVNEKKIVNEGTDRLSKGVGASELDVSIHGQYAYIDNYNDEPNVTMVVSNDGSQYEVELKSTTAGPIIHVRRWPIDGTDDVVSNILEYLISGREMDQPMKAIQSANPVVEKIIDEVISVYGDSLSVDGADFIMDKGNWVNFDLESDGSSIRVNPKVLFARTAKILKRDGKWVVTDSSGSKVLGTHDTKEKAEAQLAAIEISKKNINKDAVGLIEGPAVDENAYGGDFSRGDMAIPRPRGMDKFIHRK